MQIRIRKLTALAAPFLLAPIVFITGATAASADITMGCGSQACNIYESMGNGECVATVWRTDANGNYNLTGDFARVSGLDYSTGYTCNFFFQRNVNNAGWYTLSSFPWPSSSSGVSGWSPNYWNGAGYQARACLQFNWGSSLGAVHCGPALSIS